METGKLFQLLGILAAVGACALFAYLYLNAILGCVVLFVIAACMFLIYFAPCVVATNRGVADGGPVFIVNVVFGWTLIGWMVAMVMAITSQTKIAAEIEQETLRQLRTKSNF